MKLDFLNHSHTHTPFVKLDTGKCKACWNCLVDCPNNVIGKVDLPWHKHALIVNPDICSGCLKCVNICEYDAYSKNDREIQDTVMQRKKILTGFLVNNLLLIVGIIMVFSGLTIQFGYHMGGQERHHGNNPNIKIEGMQYEEIREINTTKIVCGFNYTDWSTSHKYAIVLFSMLMIYHIYIHWKWYTVVITKHLIGKNFQVITLSVLFLAVAVTGMVPWFIDLTGSTSILRLMFIEIHDKLALLLVIYLILHMIKRVKWFKTTYAKLIR